MESTQSNGFFDYELLHYYNFKASFPNVKIAVGRNICQKIGLENNGAELPFVLITD